MVNRGGGNIWTRWLGTWLAGVAALAAAAGPASASTSVFESAPADPRAVTVKG